MPQFKDEAALTTPPPDPTFVTMIVPAGSKTAVTLRDEESVTEQFLVPEHAPVQPTNMFPGSG